MIPEDYCRETAAPAGSTFYYGLLYHAPRERRALHALFAFRAELNAAVEDPADVAVAQSKLGWWREEIARIDAGAARHPVGMELQNPPLDPAPDPTVLLAALAGAESRLAPVNSGTTADWIADLAAGEAGIWRTAARLCGVTEAADLAAAERVGGLVTAVETFQALALDLQRGRCRVPVAGLAPGAAAAAAELTACIDAVFGELEACQSRFTATGRRRALFCIVLARLAAALCREMSRHPEEVLQGRMSLTPIRKLWIAWRTRRRA